MPLNNLYRRIDALVKFDVRAETIDIININSEVITNMLKEQLSKGKDGNDEPVTLLGRNFYSDRTVFDKEFGNYPALGKITDWITNYQTGDFYKSLKTTASGTTFKTESNVLYFDEILKRSGDIIMKLNKLHLKQFTTQILVPELRRRFKRLENGL